MKSNTPNNAAVGWLDARNFGVFADLPKENTAVRPAGHEHALMRRMPRKAAGLLLVTFERLKILLQIADVEQFDHVVAAGRQQVPPITVP